MRSLDGGIYVVCELVVYTNSNKEMEQLYENTETYDLDIEVSHTRNNPLKMRPNKGTKLCYKPHSITVSIELQIILKECTFVK